MGFGDRLQQRRKELGMSREELAEKLGVSVSSIGNYEGGNSTPKDQILLQMFDVLGVDPNFLYQDSFHGGAAVFTGEERSLVRKYRDLGLTARQTVQVLLDSLGAWQSELQAEQAAAAEERTIPLYFSPAAAGYAAPVFGDDYELITVTGQVPRGAELAVRIQGDSMEPLIQDGGRVYLNHDPLQNGDVGIFCVDGAMVCKQYYRDPLGMVYLFSLNRRCADADVALSPGGGQSLTCFGRVMVHTQPLPEGRY